MENVHKWKGGVQWDTVQPAHPHTEVHTHRLSIMQCEKPSRVHGDGIQKQNEKSKGICVNFSLRMEQEQAGGKGQQQQQEAGLQCAISRLQTRNRKGSSSGRRGGQQLFYWQREELSSDDFHWIFLPSEPLHPGYCVWVVYVCVCGFVCVACQYPEHVRSLCQRLQNSLHSNNTSRSPCRVAASQNSADPNICSTFQQQFRYAICLPRPLLPQILAGLS